MFRQGSRRLLKVFKLQEYVNGSNNSVVWRCAFDPCVSVGASGLWGVGACRRMGVGVFVLAVYQLAALRVTLQLPAL